MGINENKIGLGIQLSGRVPGFCPQLQTKRKRTKSVGNGMMRPIFLCADLCLNVLLGTCGCTHLGTCMEVRRRNRISSSRTFHLFFGGSPQILGLSVSPRLEVNNPQDLSVSATFPQSWRHRRRPVQDSGIHILTLLVVQEDPLNTEPSLQPLHSNSENQLKKKKKERDSKLLQCDLSLLTSHSSGFQNKPGECQGIHATKSSSKGLCFVIETSSNFNFPSWLCIKGIACVHLQLQFLVMHVKDYPTPTSQDVCRQ